MTRVLALTFGDQSQASTLFRVHQYIRPLAKIGIHVEPIPARDFADWHSVASYDAVLLQKSLVPIGKLRRLRRLSRRLVYDIDDAIWHPHGRRHFFLTNLRQNLRLKTIVASADVCVAANGIIARHLQKWTRRVAVLPMALDEHTWTPGEAGAVNNKLRIGWSGSPVNLRYIEKIEPALVEVQARFPEAEFAIFSGQPPKFQQLKFVHLLFAPGRESESIRTFDTGLLPLPNDRFAAGKSPIKGLQYMASGAAVVLSPVGAAAEMFLEGETGLFARDTQGWVQALSRLAEDGPLRRRLAENGRAAFLKNFSLSANVPLLAAALTGSGEPLAQFPVHT
jgi:glycosyltransferase involved in cell wall biosynthesis